MSTVTFNMVRAPCGEPRWENDYSMHLQNHLSREELSRCMTQLQNTTSRYYPNYSWSVILMVIGMLIPWAIYIFVIVENSSYGFPWGIFWAAFAISYVPLIAWIIWFKNRLNKMRTLLASDISHFNAEFGGRQINWRLRTSNGWNGYNSSNNSQYSFSVEIELGNNNMGYQQQPQAGFAPVYAVANAQPNVQPYYSGKEPLLV